MWVGVYFDCRGRDERETNDNGATLLLWFGFMAY